MYPRKLELYVCIVSLFILERCNYLRVVGVKPGQFFALSLGKKEILYLLK